MDRSFLFDARVVAAARDFVCVRLATYESAEEAKFLKPLFRTRSGKLENTVFAILAPDGKTKLTRTGRSPGMVFGDGEAGVIAMVAAMRKIAKEHPGRTKASALPPVPWGHDVRLALDVASCDIRPLVVVVAKSKARLAKIEKTLAPLVWSDAKLRGRLQYVRATDAKDVRAIEGIGSDEGVYVVEPDLYGV